MRREEKRTDTARKIGVGALKQTLRYLEVLKGQAMQMLLLGMREPFIQNESKHQAHGVSGQGNERAEVLVAHFGRRSGTVKDVDESRSNTPFVICIPYARPSLHGISPWVSPWCLQPILRPHHCGRRLDTPAPPASETSSPSSSAHTDAWNGKVGVGGVRIEDHILRPHRPATTTAVVGYEVAGRSAHFRTPCRVYGALRDGCEV